MAKKPVQSRSVDNLRRKARGFEPNMQAKAASHSQGPFTHNFFHIRPTQLPRIRITLFTASGLGYSAQTFDLGSELPPQKVPPRRLISHPSPALHKTPINLKQTPTLSTSLYTPWARKTTRDRRDASRETAILFMGFLAY
ncbi:hypothetical protein BDR22DRAFT_869590 [Usnea florida]